MDNHDQSILNNALQLATEAADPKAAIGVVLLRYHQAMLDALQTIEVCAECAEGVDIAKLQATAKELRQGTYADYEELHRACAARLGDVEKLCEECKQRYQKRLLSIFAASYQP